jgi:nucleolar protein 56
MPGAPVYREVVTTWFGTFVVEDGTIVRSAPFPPDPGALAARLQLRREGSTASEEDELVQSDGVGHLVSTDARLRSLGVASLDRPGRYPDLRELRPVAAGRVLRELILADADRALRAAWDPAVHLEEAVRAIEELERVQNLVGERLASWSGRDAPRLGEEPPERLRSLVRQLAAESPERSPDPAGLPGLEAELGAARRDLARLYLSAQATREALEAGVSAAVPRRAPNVAELLGPLLAARMIAQAGGLDRLARLPASTIQVLGAERAFFEHLRGRAPPPRHGLLFLHPTIQGAPRRLRGKLARALAGKVAIAARRDGAGGGALPALAGDYARRVAEIRARPAPASPRRTRRPRRDRDGTDLSSST